ncbi:L,D-transpeptidase family protein [Streptomyces sp. NPDC057539]|uniref:L,D-transpeptidase family protein n=1 Tax=Streptomyces sp. NPDC057539 TaxID=3346159 RepID=UPI00368FAE9D
MDHGRNRGTPKMLRTSALRRGLATAAVLAAGVGCTVQPLPGSADAKQGGVPVTTNGSSPKPSQPPSPPSKPPTSPAARTTAAPTPTPEPPRTATPPPPPPTPTPSRTAYRPTTLMANGSESDRVRELQARLQQTGHFALNPTGYYGSITVSAVSTFQKDRGLPATGATDTVTWQRLVGLTRKPTPDELRPPTTRPVAKPDPRCMEGRVMCISKSSRTLTWMIDGKVKSAMDVRFGSQYTPTREGTFTVGWKSRDHVSTLYDTPMPFAMFFSGGQAVHYSADFAASGYEGASHGCVNVRDEKKVASLFGQVRTGDKVVIYW